MCSFGVQGIQALHRIEKQRTRKVSATAARLIVQVWSRQKLDQRADADNSRKLAKRGKADWLTVPAHSGTGQCHDKKTCRDIDKRSAHGIGPCNVVKHESARDSLRRLGLAAKDQKSTALRQSVRHWLRRTWYRYARLYGSRRAVGLAADSDWPLWWLNPWPKLAQGNSSYFLSENK